MKRYCSVNNYFYDLDTMEIDGQPGKYHTFEKKNPRGPYVISDIPPYRSPVDRSKIIDGRWARREDLKRNGCREVDPSECHVSYSHEFAAKKGLPPPEVQFKHLFK